MCLRGTTRTHARTHMHTAERALAVNASLGVSWLALAVPDYGPGRAKGLNGIIVVVI